MASKNGEWASLQLKKHELEPSNVLARELELAIGPDAPSYEHLFKQLPRGYLDARFQENGLLFFGDSKRGKSLYQLILFPRSDFAHPPNS